MATPVFKSFEEWKKSMREIESAYQTLTTNLGQDQKKIEALKTKFESLIKNNPELIESFRRRVEHLAASVEGLAAKDDDDDDDEWVGDGWSLSKTPSAETDCGWEEKDEEFLSSSETGAGEDEKENENRDEEDTPGQSGEAEEEGGNDDNGDAHGDEPGYEGWGNGQDYGWGNEQCDEWRDDDECDDGAKEEWPYPSSTFCRRLNMLSPHQVSLPRLDQIEDFDNWDNALREICKFLGIIDTLDYGGSWRKTDSENNEEHDWLEFLVSQSFSPQFKRMLEDEVPRPSVSDLYAHLKEKLPERRRFRRSQLLAQLDKLSHATSGDNVPEYLEQFLSIRDKLLNLGEDGKVSESAIFGRFYNGLRGQAFNYLVQYQLYQSMKGESPTVLSFANYAGHLLHAGGMPQGYY